MTSAATGHAADISLTSRSSGGGGHDDRRYSSSVAVVLTILRHPGPQKCIRKPTGGKLV